MFEALNKSVGTAVVGGALAGLALAGCSGSSGGQHTGTLHCKPDSPEKWGPTPSNFSDVRIANALGVSVEAVQSGKFGGATCDEAIKPSQIVGTKAVVEGMGDICAVIGTGSDPRTDKASKQILAVCVVEASPQPKA